MLGDLWGGGGGGGLADAEAIVAVPEFAIVPIGAGVDGVVKCIDEEPLTLEGLLLSWV